MAYQVRATRLNIRQGPGTGYRIAGQLQQGTIIKPLEFQGWVPIGLTDGTVGWVAAEYLETVQDERVEIADREGAIIAIETECRKQGLELPEQIAYILATVEWETNRTFKPVREAYWKSEEWRRQNLRYYPYYGRGYVQLTWKVNYQRYSGILGIDLVNDPDLALEPEVARFILVHGFKNGVFTGKKMTEFVNANRFDFINARRCINGLDRAQEIAEIAKRFLESERC